MEFEKNKVQRTHYKEKVVLIRYVKISQGQKSQSWGVMSECIKCSRWRAKTLTLALPPSLSYYFRTKFYPKYLFLMEFDYKKGKFYGQVTLPPGFHTIKYFKIRSNPQNSHNLQNFNELSPSTKPESSNYNNQYFQAENIFEFVSKENILFQPVKMIETHPLWWDWITHTDGVINSISGGETQRSEETKEVETKIEFGMLRGKQMSSDEKEKMGFSALVSSERDFVEQRFFLNKDQLNEKSVRDLLTRDLGEMARKYLKSKTPKISGAPSRRTLAG